ncbi:MAG: glycosyltransferase [Clostridia bacterium]|nr:glycosyltransferase [Clostridia bacterium]
MKIALICDVLGEENNGTTIAAMSLLRYLKKRGHEVRLVCADADKKGQKDVYVVPNLSFGKLLDDYVAKVGVTIAKADKEIVREALQGVDVVHVLLPFLLGKEATKIAKEMGLPVTASFHMQAQNFTSYVKMNKVAPLNTAVYRFIYNNVYKHVDLIHYPTKFIQDLFEKEVKKKTLGRVISNGVHDYVRAKKVEKPKEMADKIVVLTTGRYAREKSQDTLIKAIKYSKYKDKIQLILGGQGVKEKHYKKLAKDLPVPPIFHFYSRTEIIDVLNYADMYVHPAEMELEGISCLEAIACGKLTIVSDSKLSATRTFAVDDRCVFKKRNPKDLARVIDFWIEHPEEKKACEKAYLESAQHFEHESCMEQMEAMLFDAVKGKAEEQ